MALGTRCLFVCSYSRRYFSCLRSSILKQKISYPSGLYVHCRFSSVQSGSGDINFRYENGLPVLSLPLPSRDETYQFTLKPISNTLGDLFRFVRNEDSSIERLAAYTTDGERLAQSTPMEHLIQSSFELVLNDNRYMVHPAVVESRTSSEAVSDLEKMKNGIAQLYNTLHIDQHQMQKEKVLLERLEELKMEIEPLETGRMELDRAAEKRTKFLSWFGLGLMGLQFGLLARLTWWEYSWDIMEPITYFVTYGTSIAMFAYYVVTRQVISEERA
ncbi:DgyrCDS8297 [Dimorphilus gyrociliatus]|uniref:Calcium uniporter protein n=1 Tax=Dimorphilus gyrociliatus TaxID=2664684 RepID=A0A7I8VTZ2_9ANNE|nr:DgyrCDS8297 [Dimorphilus gyrociliatus]